VSGLYVGGVGLSAPGLNGAGGGGAAAVTGAQALPPALRRRASPLTLLVCDALAQAAAEAGADLAAIPVLLGSAYGEIGTAVEMMRSFDDGAGLPSPIRFHNSVHNTPVAYASIGHGNRGFSTALAAGPETVAMALVEAAALLAERGGDALVVFADEPLPEPFVPARPWGAAAAALHLATAPLASPRARLGAPRRGSAAAAALAPGLEGHPCAGAFALVEAVRRGRSGPVSIGPPRDGWVVEVEAAAS
jgi:hypothetical protein